jgi:hypothetical protein
LILGLARAVTLGLESRRTHDHILLSYLKLPQLEVEIEVKLPPTISLPVCLGVGFPSVAHDQVFVFGFTIESFSLWSALSNEEEDL